MTRRSEPHHLRSFSFSMGANEQKGHQKPESLSCRDALNCTGTGGRRRALAGHAEPSMYVCGLMITTMTDKCWPCGACRGGSCPFDLRCLQRADTAQPADAAHGNKPSESEAVGYTRHRRNGNLRLGRSPASPNKPASRCSLAVLLHCTPRRSGRNREKDGYGKQRG